MNNIRAAVEAKPAHEKQRQRKQQREAEQEAKRSKDRRLKIDNPATPEEIQKAKDENYQPGVKSP